LPVLAYFQTKYFTVHCLAQRYKDGEEAKEGKTETERGEERPRQR
jgi:hypothetical protein